MSVNQVFLTGATGYIGAVIATKLQAAGHTVVGLARSEASAASLRYRNASRSISRVEAIAQMIGGFFSKVVKKPFGCGLVTYTLTPTRKALRGFYHEHTPSNSFVGLLVTPTGITIT
ncbi:NAD-dependent epimerase/dehydratase family protein [Nostoc sp.]|uniref:NAD-dependent epimerase/dehydratase family protein n=1 Tax=Nostoc sp. TaxID=1180 RepID=UPI002FF66F3B